MKTLIATVVLAISLACGGGGGSSSGTPAGPSVFEGPWVGTIVSHYSGSASAHALVLHDGTICFADSLGIEAVGTSGGTTTSYQAAGTIYAPTGYTLSSGGITAGFTMTGSGAAGDTLAGTYTAGADYGTFSFTYDGAASYTTPVVLANLAGTYFSTSTTDGYFKTATFTGSGAFSGTDTAGGTFTGTMAAVDPAKNTFSLVMTYTISGRSYTYTGLGYFDFGGATTFNLQGSGSSGGFAATFQRSVA